MLKKRMKRLEPEIDPRQEAINSMEVIEKAANTYSELGSKIDELTEQRKAARDTVIEHMRILRTSSVKTLDEAKVTLVEGSRSSIDEASLKKNLGARLWAKVTRRTLDNTLLNEAVKRGEVDPIIVSKAVIETPMQPSIRVTKK